jgi:predicted nucleic acid-binding Zn ribbon protein
MINVNVKMFKKLKSFRPRKSDTAPLKEVIEDLLKTYKLKGKFNETHIIASWERIMGAPIAKRTTKLNIHNKKMYVTLNSAPLKHELSMSKTKILELLNKDIGESVVEEIIFL